MEEMKLEDEDYKKKKEKMDLEFQNKLNNLENKNKMALEKERIE